MHRCYACPRLKLWFPGGKRGQVSHLALVDSQIFKIVPLHINLTSSFRWHFIQSWVVPFLHLLVLIQWYKDNVFGKIYVP